METTSLNINRLIECRKKLGITKQEAAKRMNMSQPAYLRYESGQRIPSLHVIYTMADVLSTSAEYLLGETDNPKPTRYIIEVKNEPELFEIVERLNSTDIETKKRFIAYMKDWWNN